MALPTFLVEARRKREGFHYAPNTLFSFAFMRKKAKSGRPNLRDMSRSSNLETLVTHISECLDKLPSRGKVKKAASSYLDQRRTSLRCNISATDEVGLSPEDVLALSSLEACLEDFVTSLDTLISLKSKRTENRIVCEKRIACLAYFFFKNDLPIRLLESLEVVTFESRKLICAIITEVVHFQESKDYPEVAAIVARYFKPRAHTLVRLVVDLYEHEHLSLICGTILRNCFRYDIFHRECLTKDFYVIKSFFTKYMISSNFEVISDAFATFRSVLDKDKRKMSHFLFASYHTFKDLLNSNMQSENYVAQRFSLKLLFDILFERQNHKFLMEYVNEKDNLVLIMKLMNVKSPAIGLAAYKVFKVFALNPQKTKEINNIMCKNKSTIVSYMNCAFEVQKERADTNDDMPCPTEKDHLIDIIQSLEMVADEM